MTTKKSASKKADAKLEQTGEEEVFLPCNQCHNTGGCARGSKCEKGFK